MTRVLLAGYGLRGRQWHALLDRHRACEPAGLVDPAPAARAEAERRGLRAWDGFEDALREARPDAVIVAAPPRDHADQACTALDAGVAVLVEKPLALTPADAARVADAAEAAGVAAVVGHNFRHRPTELAVHSALPALGALRHLAVTSVRPADTMPEHMRSLPHGPLWDLGTHHLDLLRTRVGRPPDEVSASHHAGGYVVRLHWDGGPSAVYSHQEGGPVFHHHEWIQGERAGMSVEPGRVRVVSPTSRPRRVRVARRDRAEARLLEILLDGGSPQTSARDAVATVAMVHSAVESLEAAEQVVP